MSKRHSIKGDSLSTINNNGDPSSLGVSDGQNLSPPKSTKDNQKKMLLNHKLGFLKGAAAKEGKQGRNSFLDTSTSANKDGGDNPEM